MENLSIQEIWDRNAVLLDNTMKLNRELMREVKVDKAKTTLRSLLFLPVSTIAFFIIVMSFSLRFIVENHEIWYLMFSGAVVAFFSLMFLISSINQLKLILSVDYGLPVLQLQKNFVQIKLSVIANLRIAARLLPFSPFVGLFVFKTIFNFDPVGIMDYDMIISMGIITILLEIISIMLLRALRLKNINKKWLNWLLEGSGSQVDDALAFLDQILEIEREDKPDGSEGKND